jgi:hypothetical protein
MQLFGIDVGIDRTIVERALPKGFAARHAEDISLISRSIIDVARPEAIYVACGVGDGGGTGVKLQKVGFDGPLIRFCLSGAPVAFPFLLTLGHEVDEIIRTQSKPSSMFVADLLANALLISVDRSLELHIARTYGFGNVAKVTPGSVPLWPIEAQKQLFEVLSAAGELPVTLSNALIMDPLKSLSGIYFPSSSSFCSCMLCNRQECIGRRHPYDPQLADRIGAGDI